jgi:hypothetical protein
MTKGINLKIEKLKILETRICDLELRLNGQLMTLIKKTDLELKRKNIKFKPEYYLGLGWGCIQNTLSIELPFWLSTPVLCSIEDEFNYNGVENEQEILMGLRHEIGHAINYSFRLYKDKEWRKLFGNINKKYKDYYVWNPWSKRHVKHLPDYYAQKHPDEDWSETFAVWLTPRSNWKNIYAKTPALDKLYYVDRVMKEIPNRTMKTKTGYDSPVEKIKMTVAEFYGINFEQILNDDLTAKYVDDLKKIFCYDSYRKDYFRDAWKFINKYSPVIVKIICERIENKNKDDVRKILTQFISISKTYKLKIKIGDEEEKLAELAVLLSFNLLSN